MTLPPWSCIKPQIFATHSWRHCRARHSTVCSRWSPLRIRLKSNKMPNIVLISFSLEFRRQREQVSLSASLFFSISINAAQDAAYFARIFILLTFFSPETMKHRHDYASSTLHHSPWKALQTTSPSHWHLKQHEKRIWCFELHHTTIRSLNASNLQPAKSSGN